MKLLLLFLISLQVLACERDDQLKSLGWIIHDASELPTINRHLENGIKGPEWIDDLNAIYYSDLISGWVAFKSYDFLGTEDMEMFGDAVFYKDTSSNEIIEIRWYAEGMKQIVHRQDVCGIDGIPLAENALF